MVQPVVLSSAYPLKEVGDMKHGLNILRHKVLQGPKTPWRAKQLDLLKSLMRIHVAHCELRHDSQGRLTNLASGLMDLLHATAFVADINIADGPGAPDSDAATDSLDGWATWLMDERAEVDVGCMSAPQPSRVVDPPVAMMENFDSLK